MVVVALTLRDVMFYGVGGTPRFLCRLAQGG
jgi:hypothetical protein